MEVGPTLFFSLVIVTISFMPIFTLDGEEGRLFRPLAFTKTYAMASAALISITLMPVLLYYLAKHNRHNSHPLPQRMQQGLMRIYQPLWPPAYTIRNVFKRSCPARAIGVITH